MIKLVIMLITEVLAFCFSAKEKYQEMKRVRKKWIRHLKFVFVHSCFHNLVIIRLIFLVSSFVLLL